MREPKLLWRGAWRILVVTALASVVYACSPSQPISLQPTAPASNSASTSEPQALPTLPVETGIATAPTEAPSSNTEATSLPAATQEVSASVAPTAAPPPPAAANGGVPADYFGINSAGEILFNKDAAALAVVMGAETARVGIGWSDVEPTPGQFNWKGADGIFNTLQENNISPLVLILSTPDWAGSSPCGPVKDMAAFGRFMGELGKRYPHVKYWSLYNEVDNADYPNYTSGGCFAGDDLDGNGQPDYADYAEMLRTAWTALHNANSNTRLVVGALAFDNFMTGLTPSNYPGGGQGGHFSYQFPSDLFKYMHDHPLGAGEKYMDDVGFNYYGIYGPYWETQADGKGILAKENALKKIMTDAGISAPLLVSETGENSTDIGNVEQSNAVVKTYVRGLAGDLQTAIWWTFQDHADTSPPPENTWKYGLIDQELKPKPSYAAFQTLVNQLSGATYAQPLTVQGGEGYLFTKNGGGKAVLWSQSEDPVTVSFSGAALQVTDLFGAQKVVRDGTADDKDASAGRIALQVDQTPIFVQVTTP